MLYMLPADQQRLRDCMTRMSLLDELLQLAPLHAAQPWFQRSARAYLEIADLFGRTAAQHHDQLVARFIEAPAARLGDAELEGVTASGPPLPVLLRSLEVLRDMRIAAPRNDLATRHTDLAHLRSLLVPGAA
jgi:hypothetical protein